MKEYSGKGMFDVSLVIPVKNEAASIDDLMSSIKKQTVQPTEILFVDGGSADQTAEIIRQFSLTDSRIRLIEAGIATPGRGRNLGIAAAVCEWIALTDAGIRLEPNWLEKLTDEVRKEPVPDVVYGNYEPCANNFFEKCAVLVYVSPKLARGNGRMRGPSIASSLLHHTVWESVGRFPDLRAAEDLIFMRRIEAQGRKIAWAPQATVWWQLCPDWASTYKKFVIYSFHNVLAGQQRYWHYGLLRNYLLGIPFLILSLVHSPLWVGGLIAIFFVRVAKNIWIRREARGLFWFLNPIQFMGVAGIMLLIDMATFVGWGKARWQNWQSQIRG